MRGRTLNNSFIILDESQNTTQEQMKMFLTRIGFGSTAVITGDITQVDLPRGTKSGLAHVIEVLKDVNGISFTHFKPRTWCATRWCSASSRRTSRSRIVSRRPASAPRRMPPVIELDLQCASTGAAPAAADLQRWCELALRQRSGDSELTIRLVDEEEGRELNRTWRQKDYATNVLSFPADVPDEFLDIPLLGDLVICVPVVEREAGTGQDPRRALGASGHPRLPASARLRSHRRCRSRGDGRLSASCWLNWGTPTPMLKIRPKRAFADS